jgi:acyl-CoA reductase-like NAD-dependent aldehyde dehydrogenase
MTEQNIDVSVAQAGHMLERATWAAASFATYDREHVMRIVTAVAEAAYGKSREYAEWAVKETGFGVVDHKVIKNQACSRGILEQYRDQDFVTPRVDVARKIVEVPRPAGVVFALTPSTNPVSTVYFKILLSLMTRNAVVISPHPMAKESCADAARVLGEAAVLAGAPDGIIQCVTDPSVPLIDALMSDPRTNVILATGGTAVVRSAYSSGNPAIGVGPGNVPVFVDATADAKVAAKLIVDSKAFDNSTLCTNESVLIVEDSIADKLIREMERCGAYVLDAAGAALLRDYMFPYGRLNVDVVGKDAALIAKGAGLRAGPRTRVLVAPFDVAVPEEPLTHEKLSPVLGMIRVPDARRGIETARAVVRIAGAGHSAAIHSGDPQTIMEFTAQVPVLRVAVNVGNSLGSSGLGTNLAPSMTIGTGFVGRSSVGENLEPKHLLNWARIAYNSDPSFPMADFSGLTPWREHTTAVPAYPVASNDASSTGHVDRPNVNGVNAEDRIADRVAHGMGGSGHGSDEQFRAEIRRLVVEEFSQLIKG